MITGHRESLQRAQGEMPAPLLDVLEVLSALDFAALSDGPLALDVDGVTATLFTAQTGDALDHAPEAHVANIDVHFVVSGHEGIVQIPLTTETQAMQRSSEADNVFFDLDPEGRSCIELAAGEFAVFFPWDIHIPLCRTGNRAASVRKVVAKVPVSRLSP
ncbi:YhcH/YjgK/YiaL family protein [Consotaella aegiceratis]|uniref:YhcH/YjgK/YiaL family protein n=1 Tax=Consotaella aegiceratis TaxID=3097961 RepID=UPI002F429E42